MSETCRICGTIVHDGDQRVLVDGKVRMVYCSQACLRIGVRVLRTAQRKARRRRYGLLLLGAVALAGAGYLRHLLLAPRGEPLSPLTPVAHPDTAAEPATFGPHWPPTDEDWLEQFARAAWVHPLPGPTRRRPASCRQLFGSEPARNAGARCRSAGRCGVDVGGELWGEHVYAVHDGVIDRLQRSSEDEPTGIYVRVSHWGGAVFTHYFHLAAIPTRLALGAHVSAGDVIGLVGDTGLKDARAHLHFALSIRPSSALPEVYWDPEPLMAGWPLRTPERGSVAGLVAVDAPAERVPGTPPARHHLRVQAAKSRRAADTTTAE